MNRRTFLQSSLAVAGGAAVVTALPDSAEAQTGATRQFYELRTYHLKAGKQRTLFDSFFADTAIPACNRAGVSQVGVFTAKEATDTSPLYVLLTHPSMESVVSLAAKLDADEAFGKAGAEFLNATAKEPSFERIESSLMVAFEGMAKLEAPAFPSGGKTRMYELRTYESHSQKAHEKKVEMFNRWEMAIFRRTGLMPVFFGKTLIGTKLPNLTYMLAFQAPEDHDKAWGAFGSDPEWKKLRATPGYTDPEIVSNITKVFLLPTAYSQI